jgi:peroxiredoxin
MVRTASTMLPLGVSAPDFQLTDVVSGAAISLATFTGKPALLVMFISVHCPFVKHVQTQLAQIGKDYSAQGLGMVAISPNDIDKYPDDAPEHLAALAHAEGFNFPVCIRQLVRPISFCSVAKRRLCRIAIDTWLIAAN